MFKRIVTALAILPIACAVLLSTSPWPLAITLVIILSLSLGEMADLKMTRHVFGQLVFLTVLAILMSYAVLMHRCTQGPAFAALGALSLYGVFSVFAVSRHSASQVWRFGAKCWVLAPLLCALFVQSWTADRSVLFDLNPVILLFFPLWVGDSAAYFVGKAFGRHQLAPHVSPKKTWEGAVANALGCIAAAVGFGLLLGVPVGAGVVAGLLAGVLGQLGDLLQSALKRSVGAKDSGWILPGHGGILDRLDSFFLSAIPVAIALWALVPGLFHHTPR